MGKGEKQQFISAHSHGLVIPLEVMFLMALCSLPKGTPPGSAAKAGRLWGCGCRGLDGQEVRKKPKDLVATPILGSRY